VTIDEHTASVSTTGLAPSDVPSRATTKEVRTLDCAVATKLDHARALAAELGSVAVAFSGGVDSSLALRICHDVLGDRCIAVTGRSLSLAPEEVAATAAIARELGVQLVYLDTDELDRDGYRRNAPDRCFFCKSELYTRMRSFAHDAELLHLVDGVTADDLARSDRPGIGAGITAGVRSILAEAGFRKEDVRAAARHLGIRCWDKPAMACLSSRIPHGEPITADKLRRVARAESVLREHGFGDVRVRAHGTIARIELPTRDLPKVLDPTARAAIVNGVKAAGFVFVTLDLVGRNSL
jgi:uncharacterized protein